MNQEVGNDYYSIDFGGSTLDIVRFDKQIYTFIASYESSDFNTISFLEWLPTSNISKQIQKDKILYVTGGKSSLFPSQIEIEGNTIIIHKVHEFLAISQGAKTLSQQSKGLAISLGTGTAMIQFDDQNYFHVKGTGIGGGTLMGLARAMIHPNITFTELESLAEQGDVNTINLSVGDIVGGSIGMLDASATASNFAKYSETSRKEDIAIGIVTLVSESIVALAIEKSLRLGNIPIIAGGKLAKLPFLQKKMKDAAKLFHLSLEFPNNAGIMTAIGAGQLSS